MKTENEKIKYLINILLKKCIAISWIVTIILYIFVKECPRFSLDWRRGFFDFSRI